MKKRATMMLEYLIADYAAENLDGLFVGAHSRVYDRRVSREVAATVSSDFGWVCFGLGYPLNGNATSSCTVSGQRLRAAGDPRSGSRPTAPSPTPTTNANAPATAGDLTMQLHGPVYKTTYMRKEYAVRLRPGRHAAADPAALLGRDLAPCPMRAACTIRSSR